MKVDLTDPEERRKAVAGGYIWQAPQGAIVAALRDIQAGLYPAPAYIPSEYSGLAASLGIKPDAQGGLVNGPGPA
jgi:hypothetical protein